MAKDCDFQVGNAHLFGNSGSRIDVPGAAEAGDVRASFADETSSFGAVGSVAAVDSPSGSMTGFEVAVGRSGNRTNSAALTPALDHRELAAGR